MRETQIRDTTRYWQGNEGDSNQRHYSKQYSGVVSAQTASQQTDEAMGYSS